MAGVCHGEGGEGWGEGGSGEGGSVSFELSTLQARMVCNNRNPNACLGVLPGKGPSPGGRNSVPRTLPSFTGILLTPAFMYDFSNVALVNGSPTQSCSPPRCKWPSNTSRFTMYGLVTSFFSSLIPFLCPGNGFMLHIKPIGSTPV